MTGVALAFQFDPLVVPLDRLLPSRKVPVGLAISRKFKQIKSSIEEVGLIEPLSVGAADSSTGQHLLLDGHVRMIVLKELGHTSALCLMATDDETYTYNNRVNRLSSIQEHYMLRRAVERGVPAERLAKALSVDISQIVKKLNLLDGICPEAIDIFKDKHFSAELARVFRKMKPIRQVECAELMVSANNLTVSYAEALLVATPAGLMDGTRSRNLKGVTPEQMARMEREMANLQGQYRLVEQSYGQDVLNFVLTRGYLSKLLANPKVAKYLKQQQPEVHEQLAALVEATSLD